MSDNQHVIKLDASNNVVLTPGIGSSEHEDWSTGSLGYSVIWNRYGEPVVKLYARASLTRTVQVMTSNTGTAATTYPFTGTDEDTDEARRDWAFAWAAEQMAWLVGLTDHRPIEERGIYRCDSCGVEEPYGGDAQTNGAHHCGDETSDGQVHGRWRAFDFPWREEINFHDTPTTDALTVVLQDGVEQLDDIVRKAVDWNGPPVDENGVLRFRTAPLPPFGEAYPDAPSRIVVRTLRGTRPSDGSPIYEYNIAMPMGAAGWMAKMDRIRPQDVDGWVALDGEAAVWGMEGIAWGDLPEEFRATYMHALASFLLFSPQFHKPLAEALADRLLRGRKGGRHLMDRLREEAATKCRKRVDEVIGKSIGGTLQHVMREKVSDERVSRIIGEQLGISSSRYGSGPRVAENSPLRKLVADKTDDLLDDVVEKQVTSLLREDIEATAKTLSRKLGRSIAFTLNGLGDKLAQRFEDD